MAEMTIDKDRIDEIVRDEVGKWLANIWRNPSPEIRCKLDEGLDPNTFVPKRAHDTDAGADLRTTHDVTIPAKGSAIINTGVHIELPKRTCGLLVSKSGLNVKFSLTSTGLIDEGYTGEIMVKVYNDSDEDFHFSAGDKVSQLVILPVLYPKYVRSHMISGGERGNNGFGSTSLR